MEPNQDARGAWGPLAEGASRCELAFLEAQEVSSSSALVEDEGGRLTWVAERLHMTSGGGWLLSRHSRVTDGGPERVELVLAATTEELVERVRRALGMTPGLVEVLGRGGIEIGLEPGEEEED